MPAQSLEFKLKLVTPAFIAGAMAQDVQTTLHHRGRKPRRRVIGRNSDGLRVPSLRGVLRFWFRAKEGLMAELAEREARIFGGTEVGQGVRLIPMGQSSWSPEKIVVSAGGAKAYLGYGPLNFVQGEGFSSENKFSFRGAIPAGTEFSFTALGSRRQIEELRCCLLLLHLFGGVGSRSRRGWGSVEVRGEFVPAPNPGEGLEEWISRVLEQVWPEAQERPSGRASQPAFSAFSAGTSIRAFHLPAGSPDQVLQGFYDAFRATRLYNRHNPSMSPKVAQNDHALEWNDADPAQAAITGVPQRIAFGLPYAATMAIRTPRERSIQYEGRHAGTAIVRRSSPLFLKVLPGPGAGCSGIALFLQSDFFGRSGTRIGAERKTGT